jgi:hypothetical protein
MNQDYNDTSICEHKLNLISADDRSGSRARRAYSAGV